MRLPAAPFLVLSALCAAPSAAALNVRVLIASAPTLTVNTAPDTASTTPLSSWAIGVRGGKLTLGGQDTGNAVLSLPEPESGTLEVAGRRYRGGLILRAEGSKVQAINAVDIEAYLRGVVPSEMPPLWPQAAVRAQAIIARTYAAARINPAAPYDLCATTQCQVYEGVGREHPLADAAIAATRAEVVSSAGQLADTYFSADSGGYTASSQEAWGRDVAYLKAQPDPTSPSAQKPWTLSVTLGSVQDVAGRYGVKVGKLSGVAVSKVSASGRVMALSFTGQNGSQSLAGADAGGLVRSLGAKSSRVTLKVQDGSLTITGTGAGHGVGLSQWGAKGLAERGESELSLLNFYYPGAGISVLTGPEAARPRLEQTLPLNVAALSGFGPLGQLAQTEGRPLDTLALASAAAPLPFLAAPL
ncbi:sporulation protein [Deinococcus irradiatisoli]|uniref:Sporulation protein n=1 Tax=Deinococcus irradiatisoli TaxID=2202254 RepID=A0A2Z3JPT7_9DEIO|nr:SpoIID/LytB domain-containing protein [Deinococcus irradiatisoli]AWN24719.1 sporulation protein [Deinococcus irradiatisoli]